MEYKNETKNCQNCKKDFTIEIEDFNFYEKIKVPPPTFCPECRLQRRLVWMINIVLFKRKCDFCGNAGLSMYKENAPYKIYCHKCWWSDNWDAKDYSKNIDFNRSFLDQWNELLHDTPILGLSIDSMTSKLSPYTNHTGNSKNCYMIYYSDFNEESIFGFQLTRTKNVYIGGTILDSENIYDSSNLYKSFNIINGIGNNRSCYDCSFIRDCEGAHNCFGAVNVKNGSYVFMGERLSKKEYEDKVKNINLGSYKEYIYWKKKTEEYFKNNLPQPVWETLSNNISGSYVFNSKNCKESYDVTDCKDSKHLMLIKEGPVHDCYDYVDWGLNADLVYEAVTVGENVSKIKFCHESGFNIENIEYCKLQTGGANCFGCVSLKKAKYCILNKEYPPKEYFKLKEKIIKNMMEMPYIDKKGNIYKYGEFFPMEFSPHAYNNTFANFFFPKNNIDVKKDGLNWYEQDKKEYPITISYKDLPDNIKDTNEDILKEIIKCSSCERGYKIIKKEIDLAKKLNVPISRQCPFCRIGDKINIWVSQMRQFNRVCDNCGINFKSNYTKELAPKLYCINCYKKEVY